MIREMLADAAQAVGRWCLSREKRWHRRGEFFADIAEWIDGPDAWAMIRARRKGEG